MKTLRIRIRMLATRAQLATHNARRALRRATCVVLLHHRWTGLLYARFVQQRTDVPFRRCLRCHAWDWPTLEDAPELSSNKVRFVTAQDRAGGLL